MAIVWWCMACKHLSMEQAIGAACIPWTTTMVAFLLNGTPAQIGNAAISVYLNTALFSWVVYSTLLVDADSSESASLATRILAGFALVHGLALLLSPNIHALVWGNARRDNELLTFVRRSFGIFVLAMGVSIASLLSGAPLLWAYGSGWSLLGVLLIPVLHCHYVNYKMDLLKIYVWMPVFLFVGASLMTEFAQVDDNTE